MNGLPIPWVNKVNYLEVGPTLLYKIVTVTTLVCYMHVDNLAT